MSSIVPATNHAIGLGPAYRSNQLPSTVTTSGRHPVRGHLSFQAARLRHRQGHLRPRQRPRRAMGQGAPRRIRSTWHRPVSDALRKQAAVNEARKGLHYFTLNRKRMACPKFRPLGLCVTTRVVEGACKSVITNRLKYGGLHWTVHGANGIIAPRCAIASNRFDDCRERQAATALPPPQI